ncbi:NitT/TauT family transport system ATP-binding protein [Lachnotalea glycerini]|jgi:NitT/TauT family transport system ATP-binding protein|uniref:ABC transporter ATP-binding protein n=1 Tax=Lachnotalea glycerini TaxID=1763509 RepID=A0A255I327_9FIRM|nr:ABC transporter ATP-binding protein [Lachnotalea glycerini]PXV95981.1 NitT/TauT family transport system ATP-binding protein [Lachnotalea glycerini]RDY32974.1 ABC transporter ATP-binding protein [Lachnotalea glycerini]
MKSFLELKSVSYAYHNSDGETPALKNISFDVNEGEFIAIVGPSGCGKSTLLSLIAGLITPEYGSILINGTNVLNARSRIGYMLQKDHLFEWRNIYKNIILGLEVQKKLSSDYLDTVNEMLINYGLDSFRDKRPSELSGGMRQRAALIRTLALKPSILLLDEPFSALDYQTRLTVSDDIGCIIKKEKKTAILVTHDLSEAISLGDKVVVLSKRPATIKAIVPIHFALANKTPLGCRNALEFKDYFNAIWKELNYNE